ncbi:S41 family peptidase [Croceiramulus getboli]|nr:S41 family peptidase [Flavobacteriaceae bacterium YJPT1-3]
MKLNKVYLPVFLAMAIALGMVIGGKLDYNSGTAGLFGANSKKEKLNRLIDYIDFEYVDDINTDSIVEVTVNGILENLDPHSVYIPPQEVAEIEESMRGDFVGIGVSFYAYRDSVAVIQAISGGPSDRVGIRGGDRIVYANGQSLVGNSLTDDSLTSILKGKVDTPVSLVVKRRGADELLNFKLKRSVVPIQSVDASYMLTDSLGYVKINRFAESTHKEFEKALQSLRAQGATQIALDLRNNPGGYISAAEKVADEFLKKDKLILFTKNKSGKKEETFATRKGTFEDAEVFVLINENSASASEIVAGAIQDNDKGLIVGRRSFGKGLVQREMALGDGSAVRLTIARYYTPTGRSIQRPYGNGNKAYFNDYLDRYKNGELNSVDSIQVADSLKFRTPLGKIVYGGGGIIPDVFVAKDTNFELETLNYALRSGFMARFVFELLEEDRPYYNSLSLAEFKEEIEISDENMKDFLSFAADRNFKISLSQYQETLKRYIKATMAQQLFGNNVFEQMLNEYDPVIEKVIALSKS